MKKLLHIKCMYPCTTTQPNLTLTQWFNLTFVIYYLFDSSGIIWTADSVIKQNIFKLNFSATLPVPCVDVLGVNQALCSWLHARLTQSWPL